MSELPEGSEKPLITVGVLADTHIPDRVKKLHPNLIPAFSAAQVGHILHAGDICSQPALDMLSEVAPVSAVRGNRDWLVHHLPLAQLVELGGVKVGLMHGHGNFRRYLWDKFHYITQGYHLKRYLDLLTQTLPTAKVVVYGHTHRPELLWHKEKLLFNPGSASFGFLRSRPPTVGLLHIYASGKVSAEYVLLEGWRVERGNWKPAPIYSPL